MKRIWLAVGTTLIAGVVVLAYQTGRAGAYGIPATGALAYNGSLLTFGAPDNSTHTMSIALFVTGTTPAVCSSTPGPITCLNGQFTIPVPDACVPFIHQNPNMQVQVTVDGTALGLKTLTAVPYTVEADTASNPAPGSAIAALAPPGTVIAYAGNPSSTPPSGWLYCNGQSVSRTTYANLYAIVGNAYGTANSTSFNVPDFRGYFLRGWDNGTGRDPDAPSRTTMNTGGNSGNAIGSVEGSVYASHNHGVNDPGHAHAEFVTANPGSCPGSGIIRDDYNADVSNACPYAQGANTGAAPTGISIQNAGGNETRPLNANVAYLIKY